MKTGIISIYPDARTSGNEGDLIVAPWQYMHHFRGTVFDDGTLGFWFGGGILDVIEDRYLATSDGHRCEQQRIGGSSDLVGEANMYSVCRTPAAWPDSKRWLLAWSGSYRSDPMSKAYRVWIGLATAPAPGGPWTCRNAAITSQHIVVTPPQDPWWPPGVWAASLLTVGDRVFLLDHDSGVPFPGARPRSALHEILPDLTSEVIGGIKLSDEVARSWIYDMALRSDGTLVVLTGDSSHMNENMLPVAEYAVPAWNPDVVCIASKTGRVWWEWILGNQYRQSDPGYVRTPEGGLVEPTTVLTDLTTTTDPTARDWKCRWQSDHDEVARLLSVTPARPRLEPQGADWEVPYLAHPDPQFTITTWGDDQARVQWHDEIIYAPMDVPPERVIRNADGTVSSLIYLPSTFPDYTNPEWAKQVAEGKNFSITYVRGRCMVYCTAPGSGSNVVTLREMRW